MHSIIRFMWSKASAGSRIPVSSTQNSSPPIRATVSVARLQLRMRSATLTGSVISDGGRSYYALNAQTALSILNNGFNPLTQPLKAESLAIRVPQQEPTAPPTTEPEPTEPEPTEPEPTEPEPTEPEPTEPSEEPTE